MLSTSQCSPSPWGQGVARADQSKNVLIGWSHSVTRSLSHSVTRSLGHSGVRCENSWNLQKTGTAEAQRKIVVTEMDCKSIPCSATCRVGRERCQGDVLRETCFAPPPRQGRETRSCTGEGGGGAGRGRGGGVGTKPWWLALLACGGAYWPLTCEPSAMPSRHPHCRGHLPAWGGGESRMHLLPTASSLEEGGGGGASCLVLCCLVLPCVPAPYDIIWPGLDPHLLPPPSGSPKSPKPGQAPFGGCRAFASPNLFSQPPPRHGLCAHPPHSASLPGPLPRGTPSPPPPPVPRRITPAAQDTAMGRTGALGRPRPEPSPAGHGV